MSQIIPVTVSTSGDECPICLDEFAIGETRYTHLNGEQHGFHEGCLASAVKIKSECAVCRAPLDPSSILSMRELVLLRAEPAWQNAVIATLIGIGATISAGFGWAIAAQVGGPGLGAGAAGVLTAAGAGVTLGAHVFDTLKTNLTSQQNIAIGATIGVLSAALCNAADPTMTRETAATAIVLVSGLLSTTLTLLRGY